MGNKMKTNRAAAKRFKLTGSGRVIPVLGSALRQSGKLLAVVMDTKKVKLVRTRSSLKLFFRPTS